VSGPTRRGGAAGSGSARKTRVEHAIRETLGELITADVKDPRVHAPAMLTIARVELNVDLSVARCYVSVVGDDATADAALEGLHKAAGFLRGPLGRRLGLQRAPELRFFLDPTIDMSEKLAAIVREDEERARAAGRGSDSTKTTETEPGGLGRSDKP
jgi:ribosome-binding factor A